MSLCKAFALTNTTAKNLVDTNNPILNARGLKHA